jgi:hypothetical protein
MFFFKDAWVLMYLAVLAAGSGSFVFLLKRFRALPSEEASAAGEDARPSGQDGAADSDKAAGDYVSPIRAASELDAEDRVVAVEPKKAPVLEPLFPGPSEAEEKAHPPSVKTESEPPAEAAARAPAPETASHGVPDPKTSTLGLSPAAAYIQGLKSQMEHFEKEVHQLREEFESFMTHHDQQFESMVKRLEDLAKRAQAPVRAPSALARPPQSSGGKAAPAAQRPPAASVQLPLPKPAPAPAPDVAPAADPGKIEEPLRLAPSAVKPGPEPAAPADSRPAQASPPPDGEPPKPKSRGLVWPV